MGKAERLSKGKMAMIVTAAVLLVVIAVIAVLTVLNYRSSQIPKMSSVEVLQYTLKNNVKGLVTVGIIDGNDISYSVYGKDGKQIDKALHTYEIGSLTKTVTASLVAEAVKEGKIDIDESLDNYLQLPAKVHYPTIRDLLTHTSGYKPYYIDGPMVKSHFTQDNDFYGIGDSDILKRLAKENISENDYKYNYSNFGYATLGLILEKVYATEFTMLVNDYLKNLGLDDTHISDGSGDIDGCWNWMAGDTYLSAGGLVSNVEDMLKYARLQLDEVGTFADTHTPLKLFDANQENYKKLGIRIDGVAYGWVVDTENGIVWHNGGTTNFNAYLGFSVKDNVAVVVLSNLSPNYRIPATVLGRKILTELIGK